LRKLEEFGGGEYARGVTERVIDGRRSDGKPNQATQNASLAADVWRRMLEYHIAHQRYLETARQFGLNPGATKLLLELEPDDPRPMRALAETFACDASNVTWMVDQLEERGLVERRTFRDDRRVKTVALTALGEKTKAQLLRRVYAPPDDLVALPHRDLVVLREALAKLPS